jgi:hypothetical integral membrane protein (TIGR02206 family)
VALGLSKAWGGMSLQKKTRVMIPLFKLTEAIFEEPSILITPSLHITMLVVTVLVIVVVNYYGKKAKQAKNLAGYSHRLGFSLLFLWSCYVIYYLLPAQFTWSVSLPLHLCDLVGAIAFWAILKPGRVNRALLYFLTFSLSTQAFITPVGDHDPTNFRFYCFWGLHIAILSAAVFDLWVRKYRPSFRDLQISTAFCLAYVAIVFPINICFHWNYGYIGPSLPENSTLLNSLGPWPLRVLWIMGITFLVQSLLYFPWRLYNWRIAKNKELKS